MNSFGDLIPTKSKLNECLMRGKCIHVEEKHIWYRYQWLKMIHLKGDWIDSNSWNGVNRLNTMSITQLQSIYILRIKYVRLQMKPKEKCITSNTGICAQEDADVFITSIWTSCESCQCARAGKAWTFYDVLKKSMALEHLEKYTYWALAMGI